MSDNQGNIDNNIKVKNGDSLIGELFDDKYRVSSKLGGGGMGLVFEAHHEWMERRVALKVLRPTFIDADEYGIFLERFKREAQTASRINHPNAVTIYDFGIYKQMPYLAMQFIEGMSLSELIKKNGPIEEKRAVNILIQVLDASIAAHAIQIIHRDIKPDNVMISSSTEGTETAHVLDFGIAKVLDNSEANANMTLPGKTVGTPRYMSPEQVLAKPIDARTDIYALGLVLYEMLSGDIPFKADSSMQLMFHHVNTEPLPIREVCAVAKTSKTLEGIVMKALEKEPANRFQTAAEMKEALESLYASGDSASRVAAKGSKKERPSTVLVRKLKQRPSTIIEENPKSSALFLGVCTALVLIGIANYLLLRTFYEDSATDISYSESTNSEESEVSESSTKVSEANDKEATSNEAKTVLDNSPEIVSQPDIQENQETTPSANRLVDGDIKTSVADDSPTKTEVKSTASIDNNPPVLNQDEASVTESLTDEDEPRANTVLGSSTGPQAPIQAPTAVNNETDAGVQANKDTFAEASIAELIANLAGEDRRARERSAIELQKRGKQPVPELINTLRNHKSPRARYWAVFILGKLRAVEATDAIVEALNDSSGMVQQTAKKALRATNPQRANKELGESNSGGKKGSGILGIFD